MIHMGEKSIVDDLQRENVDPRKGLMEMYGNKCISMTGFSRPKRGSRYMCLYRHSDYMES